MNNVVIAVENSCSDLKKGYRTKIWVGMLKNRSSAETALRHQSEIIFITIIAQI